MPTPVRWLIRGMQYFGGRSKEACGEYMFKGLYRPEYRGGDGGGGFHLLDQACDLLCILTSCMCMCMLHVHVACACACCMCMCMCVLGYTSYRTVPGMS